MTVNTMQVDIQKFMEACDQEVKKYPQLVSEEVKALRIRLMKEELLGKGELIESMIANDLTGIADGIADVLYVVIGTAIAYGINIQEIFDEIQRSNMSKAIWDDVNNEWVVVKDEGGKVVKPLSYSPPNLVPIIANQIKVGKGETVGVRW